MFTAVFKLLLAVLSKIVFIASLFTALVATRWYLQPFILRGIEWLEFLSYHRSTILLTLFFMAVLRLQRLLYTYRDIGKAREFERLLQRIEERNYNSFLEGPSSWRTGEFDTILDLVLREASGHIFGSQTIPDVCKTFDVPVPGGFGLRKCRFSASSGNVQHMNSLYREGRATIQQQANGSLLLSAAVGLRRVFLTYSQYSAHVNMGILPPFYASGEIMAVLPSLALRVEVVLSQSFSAELRSVRVEKLDPLHLEVTGLGEWTFMWPKIREAVLPTIQEELKREAVNRVKPILQVALWKLTRAVAGVPKIRLLPESTTTGGPRMIEGGALQMEPALTLTPTTIAVGGGLLVGGIALLGMGLAAALSSPRSRSGGKR